MYFYPGALHMHTIHSDGTGTVEHLARSAQQAGLRWIIITDHDTLAGQPQEGWLHDVLVTIDHEITPDRNHFLALNVDEVIDNTLPPQDFVDEVYARGGFGIIAHPDERVKNTFKDIYRWDDWGVDGPRDRAGRVVGIELWNFMSDWGEQVTSRNKTPLFLRPQLGIRGPTSTTLAWWDRLNMTGKRTFGVGGVDAHAFKIDVKGRELEVFAYPWTFRTLTNYLLLDQPLDTDPHAAIHQVYGALAAGRSYFVNRMDGECAALVFRAERAEQQWHMGDTVSLADGPLMLVADAGLRANLRLVHNGVVRFEAPRAFRARISQPGVYRLEGHRHGRPWLFANPIYVTE